MNTSSSDKNFFYCLGSSLIIIIGVLIFLLCLNNNLPLTPMETSCDSFKKYIPGSSYEMSTSLINLWHNEFKLTNSTLSNSTGYAQMICPSYFKDYQIFFGTALISKSQHLGLFSYSKNILDCHNEPILQAGRYLFGTSVKGKLENYTILWNLTSTDQMQHYGYLVVDSLFSVKFKIVDPDAKILVDVQKDILSLTSKVIIDNNSTNPAADPRVVSSLYAFFYTGDKDSCNTWYYDFYFFLWIFTVAVFIFIIYLIYTCIRKRRTQAKESETLNQVTSSLTN